MFDDDRHNYLFRIYIFTVEIMPMITNKKLDQNAQEENQIKVLSKFLSDQVGMYLIGKIKKEDEILFNLPAMVKEIKESLYTDGWIASLEWLCTKEFLESFLDECIGAFIGLWLVEYPDDLNSLTKEHTSEGLVSNLMGTTEKILKVLEIRKKRMDIK